MTRGRMIVWTAEKLEALRQAIAETEDDTVIFVDRGTKHNRMNVRHFMSKTEAIGLEAEVSSAMVPTPKFPENREGGEP